MTPDQCVCRDVPRLIDALPLDSAVARLEIRALLGRALGRDRTWLISHGDDELAPDAGLRYEELFERRLAGEPIAYILGEREFYGRMFKVTPDVLIPRPETELLVEAALARLPKHRLARVLDLGTGSGCVAITLALERPDCEVWAADLSVAALEIAMANASRLGAGAVRFQLSDWYAQVGTTDLDMILSNPPYVASGDVHLATGDLRHEPLHALASGPAGLDAISAIVDGAAARLHPDGWLLFEHGHDQAIACQALLNEAGLESVFTLPDLAGHSRVTGALWRGLP